MPYLSVILVHVTSTRSLQELNQSQSGYRLQKKRPEMPRKNKENAPPSAQKAEEMDDFHAGSSQSSDQGNSPLRAGETPMVPQKGKKRVAENDEEPEDFGQGIQKMLECFGTDYIKNSLMNKKKRLEQLTQGALRASSKTVDDIWRVQTGERHRLQDEFYKQANAVFLQWESDLEKTKDQEVKLTVMFNQQQKLFEQTRAVQSQRLKTIKQLHSQYAKGLEELEKSHQQQASNAQVELRKEMSMLQKKILMDTQQQEMNNVKKSLQSMLF
ncbi:synaptonemal complex protein 3-like isoform X2 [Dreissena polymorpha]|uniref:synaptonemal complex protein 3-like isoform X2 n=1 Tax=Dreissena polymorpha TaxID=45954 RepID=UPI002263ABB2|nr:synaptonemal complex protein 3-like isoform X2 [Dreissena polymorpha]